MELREALYSHRAVRDYSPEPVSEDVLRELVDAAIQAPSAMNAQPWSFSIVRDKELLARISREAKSRLLQAPPSGISETHLHALVDNETFDIFYHAPALVVICGEDDSRWTLIDCALAAENLMLAARGLGLGTCWIGLAESWLKTPEGRATLQLPEETVPIGAIIVGRPAAPAAPVARNAPQVRWIG
ncbi:MAG: nitroreductase family protein [Sphingomonadales bacterium]